jgi:hypothetical protein
MSKSGKITWLVVLVLGIWGTIGYRIYQGLEPDKAPDGFRVLKHVGYEPDSKEDFPLNLNYPDPFLKKNATAEKKHPVQKAKSESVKSHAVIVQPSILIDWSRIQYLGSIYNASRKMQTASLRFDNVDYFARQGEIVNGFKIDAILRDSIQISFGEQKKFIKKR